ncbi:UNVERIFIED_CONTAM: hypothetical protein RMT77_003153 [Armadillidium vulgare]
MKKADVSLLMFIVIYIFKIFQIKMEFSKKTPKSQHIGSAVSRNPYASGGKNYLTKFQKNRQSSIYGTPPRSKPYPTFKKSSDFKLSRARNILNNSQFENSKPVDFKFNSQVNGNSFTFNSKKRPFDPPEDEELPNLILEDDDDEEFLSSKYSKKKEHIFDKENSHVKNSTVGSSKFQYSNKKNSTMCARSKILHDISPEKLNCLSEPDSTFNSKERKTYNFKSFSNEKENSRVEASHTASNCSEKLPHMVGFPNFGNTCYLNAVLQTLVGLPSFISDLSYAVDTLSFPSSSLCQSLWNVVVARQKIDGFRLRNTLRTFKENVEKIDGSFSGFKMQDANEFLTQVLDSIKDEVTHESLKCVKEEKFNCSTCTPEKLPPLIDLKVSNTPDDMSGKKNFKSIFSTPSCSPCSPLSQGLKSCEETSEIIFPINQTCTPEKLVLSLTDNNRNEIKGREECVANPVTNNFEFELSESFRCLGCGEAEGRRQKHFALYVNLPLEDGKSIQEAVESCMGEDHRDLKCDKCSHDKALFLTSFTELPRVLIVQMKRYKYNAESLELIKVSSKVDINLWLHLDKVTTSTATSPPRFVKKPIRYQRKLSTLSVRNLSSELNICSNSATEKAEPVKEDSKENDTELQEVLKKSLEEIGEVPRISEKSDEEKEEEEFQTAIRLSLQDSGMSYANQDTEDEIQISSSDSEMKSEHCYRLVSVVSHFGQTTTTGHYVSDVLKCDEDKWYHYDDENVTSLSESVIGGEGRQKNGYIFFYIHRDIYNDMKKLKS